MNRHAALTLLTASALLSGCGKDTFPCDGVIVACDPDVVPPSGALYTMQAPEGSTGAPLLGQPVVAWGLLRAPSPGIGETITPVKCTDQGTFTLQDDQGRPVAGATAAPGGDWFEFRPAAPLLPGVTYTASARTSAPAGGLPLTFPPWNFTPWTSAALDLSYGSSGAAIREGAGFRVLSSTPDGGVTVAGFSSMGERTPPTVLRIDTSGNVSQPFATAGLAKVAATPPGYEVQPIYLVSSVAVDADGRTLLAGTIWSWEWRWYVARFDRLGALDPTFGQGGVTHGPSSPYWAVSSLRALPDGRVLLGHIGPEGGSSSLLRLTAEGALDGTFTAGASLFAPGEWLEGLEVDSAGGLLLATRSSSCGARLHRLDPSGAPAPGFGAGGSLCVTALDSASALTLQQDGRIVLVGIDVLLRRTSVVRLGSDGQADPSFGIEGAVLLPESGLIRGVVAAADGRLALMAGESPTVLTWLGSDGAQERTEALAPDLRVADDALGFDAQGRLLVPVTYLRGWRTTLGDDATAVLRFQ